MKITSVGANFDGIFAMGQLSLHVLTYTILLKALNERAN